MWPTAGCVHPQSLTISQHMVPYLLQQDHMTCRWQSALRPLHSPHWAHEIVPLPWPRTCSPEAIFKWGVTSITTWLLLKPGEMLSNSYSGHAHPSALLSVLGLDLHVLLPLTHPQRHSPSTECPIALVYLIWWKNQDSFSEPEGRRRRKNEGISILRCFVPVQLSLRGTLRPYLQSSRSAPRQQPRTHAWLFPIWISALA